MSEESEQRERDILRAAELLVTSIPRGLIPNDYEHLKDTAKRFADYWMSLTKFCDEDYREAELKSCRNTQPTSNSQMIVCGPVSFYSVCPHHLALVAGTAYVGYVPDNKVVGLSKMPRLVRLFAARPIIQEDLTDAIRVELEATLFGLEEPDKDKNYGTMVVLECTHSCMITRGVEVNSDCTVVTSSISGCFRSEEKGARQEFMSLINRKRTFHQ